MSRPVRYAVVLVAGFTIGSATVASASAAGVTIGSLFYVPLLNGVATNPCNNTTSHHGQVTTTCFAVVDSKGQLAVSDAVTHASLNRLSFDANGNLKVSGQGPTTVAGTVSVNNFPTTQQVSVTNFPATQQVVAKHATAFTTYFQTFTTDQLGQIFLTGPLDTSGYAKASIEIVQFPTSVTGLNVNVYMGKISGSTLASVIDSFPLGTSATIHTFDVNGPEMSIILFGGPPATAVAIQAWVFLH